MVSDSEQLPHIWSEYCDLVWFVALVKEIWAEGHNKLRFVFIWVAHEIGIFTFWRVMLDKEKVLWNSLHMYISVFQHWFMIYQGFIDMWANKLSNFWPHSMLNLECSVGKLSGHQTFKERDIEFESLGKFILVWLWFELFVVSNENQVLCAGTECWYNVGLQYFGCFLHYHYLGLYKVENVLVLGCTSRSHSNDICCFQCTLAFFLTSLFVFLAEPCVFFKIICIHILIMPSCPAVVETPAVTRR